MNEIYIFKVSKNNSSQKKKKKKKRWNTFLKKKKRLEYHQQRKKMNRIEKRVTAITFKLRGITCNFTNAFHYVVFHTQQILA